MNKNRKWSWVLVSLSLCLLILFVGYWNYQEYTKAKRQLANEVRFELSTAYNEVKDNHIKDDVVLFLNKFPSKNNYFEKDSISFTIAQSDQESNKTKQIDRDLVKFLKKDNNDSLSNTQLEKLKIDTSFIKTQSKHNERQVKVMSSSGLHLLQNDSSTTNHTRFPSSESASNSVLNIFFTPSAEREKETYDNFSERLKNNNLPSEYNIIKDGDTSNHSFNIVYQSNFFENSKWQIELPSYKAYVLKQIWPNLLFSLFLIGIVGLAFWTLISNWTKQQQLIKDKNEFINNMTHELKTPLATIGVALEAISNFDPVEDEIKSKEYIAISRNETNRLSTLVDKVLNIAQLENKQSNLNIEPVNLTQIIDQVVQSMKITIEDSNTKLELNIQEKLTINGDRVHLSNVIYNLIDNAIKYTKSEPKIKINALRNAEKIIISINDNGCGMSDEAMSKIFNRFYRIPTQDRHDVKGHGLGLSYVKEIMDLHGGKIAVESTSGKGSTFTIQLPINSIVTKQKTRTL